MDIAQQPTFKHDPLEPGFNIRVLMVEPSRDFNSDIKCRLIHTPLRGPRNQYDALSYVWGSLDMNCRIFCNEQPFYVNTNCFLALKYLRNKKNPRILWIDNICIDQSSNAERGHQVELMGSIYSSARSVIVWLGEEEPGTKSAFRRARFHSILSGMNRRIPRKIRLWSWIDVILGRPSHVPLVFQRLLGQEWPLRMWTLQEFAMSVTQVIQCGHCTLPRHVLLEIVMNALIVALSKELPFAPEVWVHCVDAQVALFSQIATGPFGRFRPHLYEESDRPLRDSSEPALSVEEIWEWIDTVDLIFHSASSRSCSIPLDRIYGVYGMLRHMGVELPRPDYSKTVPQVAQELTFSTISICGSLMPLYFFADQCSRPASASWAINWAHFDRDTNFRRSWGVKQGEVATFQDNHRPELVGSRLGLKAILSSTQTFGTAVPREVQTHEPVRLFGLLTHPMPKLAVLNWLHETMELAKTFPDCSSGQLTWEATWAALINGYHERWDDEGVNLSETLLPILLHCGMVAPSLKRHFDMMNATSRTLVPRLQVHRGEPIKEEDAKFKGDKVMKSLMTALEDATFKCQGGGLFRTPEGWIGLAMHPLEAGDVLARLHGSSVPAILRPAGNDFTLVCFASVQGIPGGVWSIDGDEEGVQSIFLV